MNSTFLIVVVIYETEFENSLTLQRLFQIREITSALPEILIYDNSLQSKYVEGYAKYNLYYKHDSNNSGVSGAYNYAFRLAVTLNKKWLILFDQDTDINDNYFKRLQSSINKFTNQKLFCATIFSNKRIISPTYYFAHRSFVYSKPKAGVLKSRFYTVINSGLTIQVKLMKELGGYDNGLPLDFSDHYFFFRYKRDNKEFVVIDCHNYHSLSSDADDSFEVVFKRFKKYYASAIVYSNKTHSYFPLIWFMVRTLKLTFKFSTFEFIKFIFIKK